ncbi:MAG TPA: xanthine dehydrogenase family protein molybdopterin-binding subunit [Candidatus Tumulicola sp.]|jgi:xanthine dehydrogenase YagR molybdenum-binding subunit
MTQPLIGKAYDRVDGPDKVTGRAKYAADNALAEMVYAVVVPSAIASGRILDIDDGPASRASGVLAILTHRNAPRVDPRKNKENEADLYLLQNDAVLFDRQPVAVVVATTFEQATHVANLLRLRYEQTEPQLNMQSAKRFVPEKIFDKPGTFTRGIPIAALANSSHRVAATYTTPTEHHNPMEPHATIARWDAGRLTLYDSTQWPFGVRQRMASVFGIEGGKVRVVSPFVGGAFGSKGTAWSHVALTAMAAKVVGRPVRLVLTRPQMFGWVGHRPQTEQHVQLGAGNTGALQAVTHDVVSETSIIDEFVEPCGVFSRDLYAVRNYSMSHTLARLNVSKPTYQRGPGESTGSFAMESAMDELAYDLKMDPLELRLRNYADTSPDDGLPYSSKRLRECYTRAADRFGWSGRNAEPRSMRDGTDLIGLGMATASRSVHRAAASARFVYAPDGTLTISSATIEQGTGSPTVYAQLASELLDIPLDRVHFVWGSTDLPFAPIAAGSQTSGSLGSVVVAGATRLRDRLATGENIPSAGIVLDVSDEPTKDEAEYATQAFGAHFVEVRVDANFGTVKVERVVSAFDGGRILNAKTANSQFVGSIVWGIGMALFERTQFDSRSARIMNANLGEYLVPTNADIPDIDVSMIESDDRHVNPAGVKGIGEVGITGCAAAIANAVYNATGIRVRSLPIRPENLL